MSSRRKTISMVVVLLGLAIGVFATLMAGSLVSRPQTKTQTSIEVQTKTVSPTPMTTPTIRPHRIGIRVIDGAGEFYDRSTGEIFVPRGNNYIRLADQRACGEPGLIYHSIFDFGLYEPARAKAALAEMKLAGYNVVRVFINVVCAGDPNGGLSSSYMVNFADFLRLARANDILVLITTDDVPKSHGYTVPMDPYCCTRFAGYNLHYLTAGGVEANTRFWQDFIWALIAQGAPFDAIFAYELRNEQFYEVDRPPLTLTSGLVRTANGRSYDMADPNEKLRMMDENLVYWVDQLREAILKLDPTALVGVGFFVPQKPNPARIGDPRVVRTYWAIADQEIGGSSVDFVDLHAYPHPDFTLAMNVENFEIGGFTRKPILMGEFGAFRDYYWSAAFAAQELQNWQVESCRQGFDGWLLWTWDTDEQPELWNALSESQVINQALSPRNGPDPCSPRSFSGQNIAMGKQARTSRSLRDNPPSMAVDGSLNTWWGAGDFPPQWIELDLQTAVSIGKIRLMVSQSPAGETLHLVWGKGPGAGEGYRLLHEFRGLTEDWQVLEYSPPAPWTGIRLIKIETRESPSWVSWREIEIIAVTNDERTHVETSVLVAIVNNSQLTLTRPPSELAPHSAIECS